MTDYQIMTNRQIDHEVFNIIFGKHTNDKDIIRVWNKGGFKYTENVSDAWPIIVENKIDIQFRTSMLNPVPMAKNGDYYAINENPLRAAMIVFLQIQENK